jgi:hypothetical protein
MGHNPADHNGIDKQIHQQNTRDSDSQQTTAADRICSVIIFNTGPLHVDRKNRKNRPNPVNGRQADCTDFLTSGAKALRIQLNP